MSFARASASGKFASPRWDEVTALFGGTFDPPHIGHREAVRGLFSSPGVKRVLILPSPSPPHKPCFASFEDRVKMVRLCFGSTPADSFNYDVEIDLSELERSRLNPGVPAYTHETLQALRRNIPQLAFVVGADQLQLLSTWYRFPSLLSLSHWIVLARRPNGLSIALKTLQEWEASGLCRRLGSAGLDGEWQLLKGAAFMKLVSTEAPDLSSTLIREVIGRNGEPPVGALLPEVASYLKERRLYGSNAEASGSSSKGEVK